MNNLEKAFRKFHAGNPLVYDLFDKYAKLAKATGRDNFSVAMIWERMRWYTTIETTDPVYKLNNNHRAYYARMWMARNPGNKGFFRTRAVKVGA